MSVTYGCLADYFEGFGYKQLKPVEIDPGVSNYHEFNGITHFRQLFGSSKRVFSSRVIYLCDAESDIFEDTAQFTWYDARANHATRTEFRLYYTASSCVERAQAGDFMVVCKNRNEESLTVFIAKHGDSVENQLVWLFGISKNAITPTAKVLETDPTQGLGYYASLILEKMGITIDQPVPQPGNSVIDHMIAEFSHGFPTTATFSSYARSTLPDIRPLDDADKALTAWLEQEETLFRALERHLVETKVQAGFKDVDAFVSFSLSIHNRRKSRAGYSLENHLHSMFDIHRIRYSQHAVTENRTKPDFLFPGKSEYHSAGFPSIFLTMLGVKTSCKDRWRQILSEADRLKEKHLFTLEPSISENQTSEMQTHSVRLVIPSAIIDTFTKKQRPSLLCLKDFLALVSERQMKAMTL